MRHTYAITECIDDRMASNKELLDHVARGMRIKLGEKIVDVLLKHGACTVELRSDWVRDEIIRAKRGMLTVKFWKPGPMDWLHEPDWEPEKPNV